MFRMGNLSSSSNNKYYQRFCLFSDTIRKKRFEVIDRIDKYNLDINDKDLLDDCNQNLLHVAVRVGDKELAQLLIEKGIDKEKENCFNEKPVDIAIQKNDLEMINILLDKKHEYSFRNQELSYELNIVKDELEIIKTENITLKHKVGNLTEKIDVEIKTGKRMRENYDTLEREHKRMALRNSSLEYKNIKLVRENTNLKKDNETLKSTIKNLRDNNKK